ncbi:MAG: hypothetical protein L0Z54_06085, partial [Thermoplasmata archaeon]|nr:hypothetical protein [Thermoplasmata archaeon]
MRGKAWLLTTIFPAMALLLLASAISAQSVENVYESIVVTHTYDVKVLDSEGDPLAGFEKSINPVIAGSTIEVTFLVQNFDADTDIDTINITFTGVRDISDQSGLSNAESEGPGDWHLESFTRSLKYSAVTDGDRNDDDDDALDRNQQLTLVVRVNVTDGPGYFDASITVREIQGISVPEVDEESTGASRSFEYLYIKVSQGDMFLLSSLSYPTLTQRCNLLIEKGSERYGVGPGGTRYSEIGMAEELPAYLNTVYIFLTGDPNIARSLQYTIFNPTANTPSQYTLKVIRYTVTLAVSDIVLDRAGVTGLDTTTLLYPGQQQVFLYGEAILGDLGGAHFIDDADDDDDTWTDEVETKSGTNPRDPREHPKESTDGTGESGDGFPVMIALVVSLCVVGVAIVLILMRVGIIAKGAPKERKPKKERKKRGRAEEEVVWEKPKRSKRPSKPSEPS